MLLRWDTNYFMLEIYSVSFNVFQNPVREKYDVAVSPLLHLYTITHFLLSFISTDFVVKSVQVLIINQRNISNIFPADAVPIQLHPTSVVQPVEPHQHRPVVWQQYLGLAKWDGPLHHHTSDDQQAGSCLPSANLYPAGCLHRQVKYDYIGNYAIIIIRLNCNCISSCGTEHGQL